MKRSWLPLLQIVLTCAVCLILAALSSAQQKSDTAKRVGVDFTPALPRADELAGFSGYEVAKSPGTDNVGVHAERQKEPLSLYVNVVAFRTEAEAIACMDSLQGRCVVPFLTTTFTGRRLAQQVYRTNYGAHGADPTPRGAYSLMLRDGKSVVRIDLMLPPLRNEKGEFVQQPFASSDLAMAEQIGWRVLQRMTAMGFTSLPADKASAMAKPQIKERLAALHAAEAEKPKPSVPGSPEASTEGAQRPPNPRAFS